jgi:hypothetical protein
MQTGGFVVGKKRTELKKPNYQELNDLERDFFIAEVPPLFRRADIAPSRTAKS